NVGSYMSPYYTWENLGANRDTLHKKFSNNKLIARKYDSSFFELIRDSLRTHALQLAQNSTRNLKSLLDITASDTRVQKDNYLKFSVEWHRKFTLSFACILLFLIGAPLGAIIRKGGLGMPLVIAIIFFMAFHILNITGEKLAKTGSALPLVGMWMSTIFLLPLAFWLVKSARNDSQIFTK